MRRTGSTIILLIIAVAAIAGTALFSYRKGTTDGQATAAADRSAFTARGTVTGGQSAEGGRFSGGGGTGGAPGGRPAEGSSVAGSGRAAGGTPGAGGGTTAAVGGITGKVTKVDGATLTVQQQPGNTNLTITTGATTTVTAFAAAAMSDLKTGDLIAVQGDKAGDNAYTAKVLLALSGERGAASAAPGGAAGGQGRGPGGGAGGAGGFPGLTGGPFGRITKIDGATITLQGLDGTTTMTVTTNADTSVRKQAEGKVADIKVGDTIFVQGEKTGDTAYTARLIVDQGAS